MPISQSQNSSRPISEIFNDFTKCSAEIRSVIRLIEETNDIDVCGAKIDKLDRKMAALIKELCTRERILTDEK